MARNGPCTISGTRILCVMHLVGGGERCLCTTCFFFNLIGRVRFGSLPCPKSYTGIVIAVSQAKLVFKCAYLFFYPVASGLAVAMGCLFTASYFVADMIQKISSIVVCNL